MYKSKIQDKKEDNIHKNCCSCTQLTDKDREKQTDSNKEVKMNKTQVKPIRAQQPITVRGRGKGRKCAVNDA